MTLGMIVLSDRNILSKTSYLKASLSVPMLIKVNDRKRTINITCMLYQNELELVIMQSGARALRSMVQHTVDQISKESSQSAY